MRLRRKKLVKNEELTVLNERKRAKTHHNTRLRLHSRLPRIDNNPTTQLYHCINQMIPHVWYKIVPSSPTDVDNFAHSIGLSWSLVQRLLLHLKYLYKYKDSYRINVTKFKELEQDISMRGEVHIGSVHPYKQKKVYYICYKSPIFTNPALQSKNKFNLSNLRYDDPYMRRLKRAIVNTLEINGENDRDTIPHAGIETSTDTTTENASMEVATPTLQQYIPTINERIETEIGSALSLDLSSFPRLQRSNPEKLITITKSKLATSQEKLIILLTMERWGYNSSDRTYDDRIRIVTAASRLIAYDNGYKKTFSVRTVLRWKENVTDQILTGIESSSIGMNGHKGSQSYIDNIEQSHPCYLHSLFRKSLQLKGSNSSFHELAHHINSLSRVETEERMSLSLNRRHINKWFIDNGGKFISPLEKPLDSEEHCLKRIDWVIKYYGLLTNPYCPVCYIDEKWFYRVNRRRKLKILPKGKGEDNDTSLPSKQKMLSRRFPIKTMFMAVVARPMKHRNFDGKIFLERVLKTRFLEKATAHQNFTDDAIANEMLKNGEWRQHYDDNNVTCDEVLTSIGENYCLDDYVTDRLELFYVTKVGTNGNTKKVALDRVDTINKYKIRNDNDKNIPARDVHFSNLHLQVRNVMGDSLAILST